MSAIVQYTLQGLASGSFYALSALGLAVIFGMLGVVNFAHGACFMLGAVAAAVLLDTAGLGFWPSLLIVPLLLFVLGVLIERLLVRWLVALDPTGKGHDHPPLAEFKVLPTVVSAIAKATNANPTLAALDVVNGKDQKK